MSTAVHVALLILVFVIGGWIVVCGGTGVAVAHMRGMTKLPGFLWGLFLGPIGWLVILFATRSGRVTPSPVERPAPRGGTATPGLTSDDLPDPL